MVRPSHFVQANAPYQRGLIVSRYPLFWDLPWGAVLEKCLECE
jgi:hypothetical protein